MNEIHKATLCLDTHIDIRWPEPPDPVADTTLRVDFPKMARGGLNAAIFIAYVGQVAGMVNAMLHFEAYTGTSVGPLTDVSRPPFMRRADLVDPTELLDAAVVL